MLPLVEEPLSESLANLCPVFFVVFCLLVLFYFGLVLVYFVGRRGERRGSLRDGAE